MAEIDSGIARAQKMGWRTVRRDKDGKLYGDIPFVFSQRPFEITEPPSDVSRETFLATLEDDQCR